MLERPEGRFNQRLPREASRNLVPAGVVSQAAALQRPRDPVIAAPAMGPQFVLHALRRWWMLTIPASVLLAGLAGVAAWFLFLPTYEAAAWFRMEVKSPFLAFQNRDEDRSRAFFQTQVEMIRSPLVLGPVIKRPEIAQLPDLENQDDKMIWLSKQLQVNSVGQSELFTIRFAGQRPSSAAKIVNAVADAYFKLRDQNESDRIQRVLDLLEREKDRRSQEVYRLREGLRELTKQVTGRDPYATKSDSELAARSPLAELQTRLIAAQVDRAVLEARVEASEDELQTAQPTPKAEGNAQGMPSKASAPLTEQEVAYRNVMVDKALAENTEIKQAGTVVVAKQAKLAEIEAILVRGKNDPSYQRLQAEIERDQQALDSMRSKIRPQLEKELDVALRARRTAAEAAVADKQREYLARLRANVKAGEILEDKLREEYEKGIKEVKQTSGETLELEFKRDELVRAEKVFELIAQRTLEIQTERVAPARVSLLRMAEEPTAPMVSPLRKVGIATLAGFLLPFALVVGWERLARRVGDTNDIEHQSHLIVLGEIACLPSRSRVAHSETARLQEGLRIFEESVDSLRTTLMLSEDLQDMRVLAVTSAAKHEGKTSVAAQLAISLARATGERVLLVDGDMRSPDVHRVFDIPRSPGLAETLDGTCSMQQAIVTSTGETVHLLPAGKLSASPHRLLGNDTWAVMLAELKTQYRYVIVDTPPTLAASESLVLAKAADATLVCTMRDVSRIDQVRQVCERLVVAGARPVGMVLSGVPTGRYAYRYGTYAQTTD